jgi:hypothetical protein
MERTDSEKERGDRAARNEALFRRVNERLEDVDEAFQVVRDDAEFVCECASLDCAELIPLTLPDYEAVRRVPTQFVIKPGHLLPDDERIVERHGQYLIVEKVGHAGERARQLDPRSDEKPPD